MLPPLPCAQLSRCRVLSRLFLLLLLCAALAPLRLAAVTLDELLNDPHMTPKRFANHFTDFRFDSDPFFDVINPNQFLAQQAGDCIDYAALADYVLKHHGYHTRLIRVEMAGKNVGHAICYVDDERVYLDYNNRRYFFNLTRSKPRIREIATKVAASLRANWTIAQEFTFSYDDYLKRAVHTVVKVRPAHLDPDAKRDP
ncbi:hypothetical protein AXK11_08620 [Cephaloticoccus primus]|uniref:Transglutaminase-like domain-containing protein n=1 Tax=Cephaloticoccus primus TaxID=1548207 RepID=A0A139SIJ9_9BACT|nr:transglutaminase-like domain-containing protein [Cephaloticoccus primus]KXU34363.1 hypothetical protein AXK11_08620 [Cephaloticoccus primus]